MNSHQSPVTSHQSRNGKVFLISGTDTGVGKTLITAGLVAWLNSKDIRTVGMKPFTCGGNDDIEMLKEASLSLCHSRAGGNLRDPRFREDDVSPLKWRLSLAPYRASLLEKKPVNFIKVRSSLKKLRSQAEIVILEGVGGLLCPLTRQVTLADWAKKEKLSVIIVARLGLGTLNHTLMTVEVAKSRGIMVKGIILNDLSPVLSSVEGPSAEDLSKRWNPRDLEELTRLPILGIFPYLRSRTVEASKKAWEKHFDFKRIYKIIAA